MSNTNNFIFLDIDGVLNNDASFINDNGKLINDDCFIFFCKAIEEIKKVKDINIVITSTWRLGRSKEEFLNDIKSNLDFNKSKCEYYFNLFASLLYNDDYSTPYCKVNRLDCIRGDEIILWKLKNKESLGLKDYSLSSEDYKYIIIDDDSDFYKYQPLLLTDTSIGFTHMHYNILCHYFLNDREKYVKDTIKIFKSMRKKIFRNTHFLNRMLGKFGEKSN